MEDKYNETGIPTMEVENALEYLNASRATPMRGCDYPNCESCDKYHGHYCSVPMVVSKQIWLTTESLIVRLENRLTELETLVTDEILGSKKPTKKDPEAELNYTWDDYFGETK